MPRSSAYNLIDVHVGERLRTRRTLLGLSQLDVADAMGVTKQQLHMYEKGKNRMSVSWLYDLSQILGVDVAYFYDEMDQVAKKASSAQIGRRNSTPYPKKPTGSKDPLHKRETLELVRRLIPLSQVIGFCRH